MGSDSVGDLLDVTYRLVQVFERLGISYLLVGSIASSMHGIPRATQDVDVVADLHPEHVSALGTALGDDFYIDAGAVRAALRQNSSFNVIHLASMFKVDVFISGDGPFSKREMQRRQTVLLSKEPRRELVVASPEDVLLHKLHWYRMSDEVSDRQWRDVLGIIKVQGNRLDDAYLKQMAAHLQVEDLLQQARAEA